MTASRISGTDRLRQYLTLKLPRGLPYRTHALSTENDRPYRPGPDLGASIRSDPRLVHPGGGFVSRGACPPAGDREEGADHQGEGAHAAPAARRGGIRDAFAADHDNARRHRKLAAASPRD